MDNKPVASMAMDVVVLAAENKRLREWLEASVAWIEHVIGVAGDRRVPSADVLADGRAIIELARKQLAGE